VGDFGLSHRDRRFFSLCSKRSWSTKAQCQEQCQKNCWNSTDKKGQKQQAGGTIIGIDNSLQSDGVKAIALRLVERIITTTVDEDGKVYVLTSPSYRIIQNSLQSCNLIKTKLLHLTTYIHHYHVHAAARNTVWTIAANFSFIQTNVIIHNED